MESRIARMTKKKNKKHIDESEWKNGNKNGLSRKKRKQRKGNDAKPMKTDV